MKRIVRCLGVVALACCLPSIGYAQAPPDWTLKVKLGRPLYVTMLNGERVEGVAGSVTEEGITVATPVGVRTAKYAEMRKVDRRDGPWNGVLIGSAVGFAIGLAAVVTDDGCEDNPYGIATDCSNEEAAIAVAGALYGGLIGWGIDTMRKGRTNIFDSNRATTRVSFAASPKRLSGRVTVSW